MAHHAPHPVPREQVLRLSWPPLGRGDHVPGAGARRTGTHGEFRCGLGARKGLDQLVLRPLRDPAKRISQPRGSGTRGGERAAQAAGVPAGVGANGGGHRGGAGEGGASAALGHGGDGGADPAVGDAGRVGVVDKVIPLGLTVAKLLTPPGASMLCQFLDAIGIMVCSIKELWFAVFLEISISYQPSYARLRKVHCATPCHAPLCGWCRRCTQGQIGGAATVSPLECQLAHLLSVHIVGSSDLVPLVIHQLFSCTCEASGTRHAIGMGVTSAPFKGCP